MVDFVAVLQVGTAKRLSNIETGVIDKQFITGSDVDIAAKECNTPKAPVPAAASEIYFTGVPVDFLLDLPGSKIDDVQTAVALALFAAADH